MQSLISWDKQASVSPWNIEACKKYQQYEKDLQRSKTCLDIFCDINSQATRVYCDGLYKFDSHRKGWKFGG
jgi:hypothetical protein